MEKITLGNLGVVELNAREMGVIDGGNLPVPVVLWMAKHENVAAVYKFFSDFGDGFNSNEISRGMKQVGG